MCRRGWVGLAFILAAATTGAATYTWDTAPGTAGVQDGSGTWDTATANWYDGTNHTWNNSGGDTAELKNLQGGPRTYTVALGGPITIGGLSFTASSGHYAYTVAADVSGVLNLGLASTPISADVQGVITAPVGGTGGLTTGGTGTLYLSSANSYAGQTAVSSDLRLRHSSALGTAAGGTTINAGGTLTFDNTFAGSGDCPDAIVLNGGRLTNNAPTTVTCSGKVTVQADSRISALNFGGRQFTFTGGIANNGVTLDMTIDSGGSGITRFNLDSVLSGSGTVNFGNCTAYLTSANTFTGALVASNSVLYVPTAGALGAAPLTLENGSELRIQNNVDPGSAQITLNNGTIWAFQNHMTLDTPIVLTGPGTIRSHNYGSNATLQDNTIRLGGNTLTLLNATANPGYGNLYVYDKITGSGSVVMGNGADTGTFWLYNTANDYTGSTTINSGRLMVQNDGVIPAGSDVVVNSPHSQALYVQNVSLTVGSLSGTGFVNTAASGALSVGYNNTSTSFGGKITGGGSLTKIGTGSLTLSGANSYTGATTVNGGTLFVHGTITSDTTVKSGATLGGGGATRAVTVEGGGTLSPGNSPDQILIGGNLTLAAGSNYLVEIVTGSMPGDGITGYDQAVVAGILSVDGANLLVTANASGIGLRRGQELVILDNDADEAVVGLFSGLAEGASLTVAGVPFFTVSYLGGTGNDVVLISLVPEPASTGLVLLGAAGLLRRRRHRTGGAGDLSRGWRRGNSSR